jgi:hypothetical protein
MPYFDCAAWVEGRRGGVSMLVEADNYYDALRKFYSSSSDKLMDGMVHFTVRGKNLWVEGRELLRRDKNGDL